MPLLALTSALALAPSLPGSRTAFACTLCALGFGFIGDVLLLSVSEKRFMAGALSFFAGHIFWIIQYVFSPNGTSAYASGGRMFFCAYLFYMLRYRTRFDIRAARKTEGSLGRGRHRLRRHIVRTELYRDQRRRQRHKRKSSAFLFGGINFIFHIGRHSIVYRIQKRYSALALYHYDYVYRGTGAACRRLRAAVRTIKKIHTFY